MIGRVSGAPVVLSPSWFLATAILTILFAQTTASVLTGAMAYVIAFAFVVLLFLSVFCHEVAHAVMARRRGHEVTELALTLWGGHTAYSGGASRPLDAFLVAVVGPVANLVLGAGFWLAWNAQGHEGIVGLLLYAAAFTNGLVGAFNLLPGLPLDGGQVFESIVWAVTTSRERGTIAAGWIGRVVAVGAVAWALWPFVATGAKPQLGTVAWAVLIGGFLWSGASGALRSARRRQALAGVRVRDLAVPAVLVSARSSVAGAGDVAVPGRAVVVVDDTGRPVAVVDEPAAAAVPAEVAAGTPVAAVAVAVAPVPVDLDLAGQPFITALSGVGNETPWVVVTHGGDIVGALETRRVILALQDAMGGRPARGRGPSA